MRRRDGNAELMRALAGPDAKGARHAARLLHTLAEISFIPPGAKGVSLPALPESVAMIRVIDAYGIAILSDGFAKFIETPIYGVCAPRLSTWLSRIGASDAAAQVSDAIKRLPRGRVPDSDEARRELVDALFDKRVDGGPFDDIDVLLRESLPLVANKIRAFLAKNPREIQQWLSAEETLKPTGTTSTSKPPRQAKPTAAISYALPIPDPPAAPALRKGTDPRVEQFLAYLQSLILGDWIRAGVLYHENLKRLHKIEECNDIAIAITVHRVLPVGRDKAEWKAARERARAQAGTSFAVVREQIPDRSRLKGKSVELRKCVGMATLCALEAVIAIRELEIRDGGADLLKTALVPFPGAASRATGV